MIVFVETAFLKAIYPRTPMRTMTAITRPMIAYKPPLDTGLLLFFNPTHLFSSIYPQGIISVLYLVAMLEVIGFEGTSITWRLTRTTTTANEIKTAAVT